MPRVFVVWCGMEWMRLLANLFVHAVRKYTDDAEGVDRARNSSESFLFGRLETLPETHGLFPLNALLPIPFDGMGTMEVDLYCADVRLAIELEGPHHFTDAQAYRRDRRKDALLQRHHIMILRFLPEDLSKRLDEVLDVILAALAFRER